MSLGGGGREEGGEEEEEEEVVVKGREQGARRGKGGEAKSGVKVEWRGDENKLTSRRVRVGGNTEQQQKRVHYHI